MSFIDLVLLGLALGIDCLVASFSQGLIIDKKRIINSIKLGLTMGGFQALMPVIGYFVTSGIFYYIEKFSKWIAFGIFLLLGIKFIYDSTKTKDSPKSCGIGLKCLLALGIGTSIDALAAGVNFRLTDVNLAYAATIIGITSFIMSLIGFWSGNRIKNVPNLELLGGIILIWLATKSLL